MKNIFSAIAAAMLVLSIVFVNAQAGNTDWGSNKFIANNSDKCVVSVTENGWIYVLSQYGPSFSSTENGYTLYVSEDEGWTFTVALDMAFEVDDYILKDVDMVATGDDPTNIKVFIAELRNTGNLGTSSGSFSIRKYEPGTAQLIYQKTIGMDPGYSVSIASDSRSPGGDHIPFAVAAAYTAYSSSSQLDELYLVYDADGGTNFDFRLLHEWPGLNRVSITTGRTINQDLGYYGIAFETNFNHTTGLGDVGLFIGRPTFNAPDWAEPVIINHANSFLNAKVCRPSICLYQNKLGQVAGSNFVPMVVAMEYHYNTGLTDLVTASFTQDYEYLGYIPLVPLLTQISIEYPFGSSTTENEKNPDLMFDKTYDNFLMTYSTEDPEELIYGGIAATSLLSNSWWTMGNYRNNTGDLPDNPLPSVDIDLSKGKAVFAWKDNYNGIASPAKAYVDAEWWVVGTDEQSIEQDIEVYPNPVQDRLYINLDKKSRLTYSICNISGQVVLEGNLEADEIEIAIPENINHGIYLLNVKSEGQSFSKKLVVQ